MTLAVDGCQLWSSCFGTALVESLILSVQSSSLEGRAGTRRLLSVPLVHEIATKGPVFDLAKGVVGPGAFPVRAILFDKQPEVNWELGYHQDRAIAVKERQDVDGFNGWSVKEGVAHVLPPVSVLEGMISVRIHLDDCGLGNGPLRVSLGTHTLGIIDKYQMPDVLREHGQVVCTCSAGDVLLMRPLLLHASSKAERPAHRRVVHIEYAASALPGGLQWYER